ncbi:MAG: 16S rRNA (cytosine(967)-C(5))-methyltransferase RsmB [Oscillospiraceae bacterium]|nr:16S rRNA (cytosine(967)-C(5))-methyltransferase RsmB [Oscillospiraceae bacterium]
MVNSRKEVLKLLNKTFKDNSYSNILLDSVLSDAEMSSQDKRFITVMYYGIIEKKITLDYIISKYSSKKLSKLDPTILNILRMGIYQLRYMDSVPDNAAVNESVKLTRSFKVSSASGFVNAVLRHFIRDNKTAAWPTGKIDAMSVKYSVDTGIIRKLISDYGDEFTNRFLERAQLRPDVFIRHNTCSCSKDELIKALEGFEITQLSFPPACMCVPGGDLTATKAFDNGMFHVQDISSQLACLILGLVRGEKVLDLCSAPGGKAFTMAQLMENTGSITAFDIHEQRAQLVQSGAARLGLTNITARQGDALIHYDEFNGADKVLCDVPCSGLGVIRKKPEIRYKDTSEFEKLPEIQYAILKNGAAYLKPGGELVYSTCTLNRAENDDIIDKFLSENEDYEKADFPVIPGMPEGIYKLTLGDDVFGSDGFFISKIKRKK